MKVRMDWKKLLKPQRFAHDLKTYNPDRSEFQRDFDRIIFLKIQEAAWKNAGLSIPGNGFNPQQAYTQP